MNIVVLVKQVPDSGSERKLDPADNTVARASADNVINEMDEYAIEEALLVRDREGGEVTVLTVGPDTATDAIRKALSMGADKAVHVSDEAIHGSDALQTSAVLAAARIRTGHSRSHAGAAEGGINAALGNASEDDPETHAYDTVKGSDYLGDQDAIEIMCREAPGEVLWLEHRGVTFHRNLEGKLGTRAFGGASAARTYYVADITGQALLHVLYEQLMRFHAQIDRYEEFCAKHLGHIDVEAAEVLDALRRHVPEPVARARHRRAPSASSGPRGRKGRHAARPPLPRSTCRPEELRSGLAGARWPSTWRPGRAGRQGSGGRKPSGRRRAGRPPAARSACGPAPGPATEAARSRPGAHPAPARRPPGARRPLRARTHRRWSGSFGAKAYT